MNTPGDAMPAEMLEKLHAVVRQDRAVRLQAGLTRALAVLLTAMLVTMALDWLITPRVGPLRWIMTLSALACGAAALVIGCLIPLFRRRSLSAVARDVDAAHPALQERCQTVTEFSLSKDAPELRGSAGMMRKVAAEAAALSGSVLPSAVVSKKSLFSAGKFFAAAAAVLALFFIVDFPRAKVLCQRFFEPSADITLTQVQAKTGDIMIGKGENVTLDFTATGKATDSAKLLLHATNGREETVLLDKEAKESTAKSSKFTYTANAVTESFDYSARSGDGQTALYHVTVLERPTLTGVHFRIESPAYSKLPLVDEKDLPRQVRALEGSKMDITFSSDQDLASLDLKFADGGAHHVEKTSDKTYHFQTVLSSNLAFEPLLINARHLQNQSPPDCDVIVYKDMPPTVTVTSPSDEITARPDDKVQIEFEARDDFGLTKADLVVTVNNADGSNAAPITIPIPLDQKELGSKLIKKQVQLDLSQFHLSQDQELSYSVRVADTKNDTSFSTTNPDASSTNANQALAENQPSQSNDAANQSKQDAAQSQNQNQGQQENARGQQATAQNQNEGTNAASQSQQNLAQNQARQENRLTQGQQNNGQNQSQQNEGQNQNQSQQNNGQNQPQENTAQNQNQSQQNNGQNQNRQNNAQNQSQQNTAQNQNQGQQNDRQNQNQQDTAQNQSQQNSGQNQPQQNGQNQSQQNGQNQSQQNTAQNSSQQQSNSQPQDQQQQNQNQNQNQPQARDQNHIAMAAPKSNTNGSPSSPGGQQPPPNNMTKRALDVASGQSSSAQPMRIKVDEFARSFDGQMREKLEIAIDPTLKLLDELLHHAHDLTETNLAAAQSKDGLGAEQSFALDESKDQLRQADRAVADLKKVSTGTAYAFIGLQVADIGDTHISPAQEELGEVTLETAKLKEDKDNLTQASFHIEQARKMLADLTKTYESVKRDNKLADAMQELKKMHQIFLEDTQAMLGSKKPPINSVNRKVAEVSDDYAEKLQKLMEEQKKIMEELAKLLADDPRMLRRFMALQELDGATLRDQMTLLADRQKTLTKQTAEWTVADETSRTNLAREYLSTQVAEQSEIASLAGKMHENMITWLPDGVEADKEPAATALALAGEAVRLAGLSAAQASPDSMTNSLESARKALDQFRQLHTYLPDMATDDDTKDLGVFAANRLNEADDLVTKESGWIKKMEALGSNDFPQSVEVDQHRVALDTKTLSEKLDAAVPSLAALSPEIKDKSDELLHTVEKQVLPEETRAVDSLARKSLKDAVSRQDGATTAFATAETQFDELLHLIVAKLDTAPPPDEPGRNQTLEDMLAMLKDEKKAAESLGIPNRPLNIQMMRDWLSPSQSKGQQSGGQGQQSQRNAQARAAQQQARDASRRTDRATDQARRAARMRAAQLTDGTSPPGGTVESGPKPPSNGWNTLASKLGDELRQSRDNVPPEQYRAAIEQYFNSISETVPATPPPAPATPADAKDKNP